MYIRDVQLYHVTNLAHQTNQVVFFTPGESAADGYEAYLTNKTLTGLFGQEIGGAVVLIERMS